MHRLINKTPNNMNTYHINGNPLDNRKQNLRNCTQKQIIQSRGKQKNNTSGFRGVNIHKVGKHKYWRSAVCGGKNGKNFTYESKTFPFTDKGKRDAAKWYNEKAKHYFGEFASINKI